MKNDACSAGVEGNSAQPLILVGEQHRNTGNFRALYWLRNFSKLHEMLLISAVSHFSGDRVRATNDIGQECRHEHRVRTCLLR